MRWAMQRAEEKLYNFWLKQVKSLFKLIPCIQDAGSRNMAAKTEDDFSVSIPYYQTFEAPYVPQSYAQCKIAICKLHYLELYPAGYATR